MIERTLLFLVVFFLPTQLGRHFWPESSQIFTLRIDYLSPTLYFWDILSLALFVCFWVQKQYLNKKALSLCLLFLLTQATSIISSNNIGVGLTRLYSYLPPILFGLYLASQERRKHLSLFFPLCASVLFEGVLGILQFLTGSSIGLWVLGERELGILTPFIATFNFFGKVFLRPYATFPHPNVFASFNFVVLALLIVYQKTIRSSALRRLVKISLAIASLSLILTFSRTTIIATCVFFLFAGRDKIKKLFSLTRAKKVFWTKQLLTRKATSFLLVAGFLLLPLVITRFGTLLSFDQISLLRRQELAQASLVFWSKNFLFGVGLNNFIPNLAISNLISGESRFLQPVHSIYLLTLAETGLVGFLGFFPLVLVPILGISKADRQRLLIVGCWIGLLFMGLFDHYLLTLPQGLRLFFLLFGLLV